ncbi:ATP-binding cassette domain-containing protein [Geodermatophilus sabuli]|uniref:ABC-2 type transport system ATP-binding protein n=1 Tax=Geodermatophilus sabuli TaxID=1564158 RepID=A0A285EJE2_9ACTN|nr:ATP-binding cassette domain-containing protein [Geodermatophilus sabuli]MBB3086982.1 ABC-2 type transport system ATP-binding protein [Geodermatophilus sabuli]SNX99238.1 ABC-2 type transport system ATP-binding protein [Geodermatophilus sabuli]
MSDAVNGPAIEVTGLTKRYKTGDTVVEAVKGIDLRVETGQTYGFLGPNGAGKSTTIEMLCTIRNPTSGTARVAGYDVVRERDQVRRRIGLVFQQQTLDLQLTAEQNLRFHAELYGLSRADADRRIDEVLEMVALADRRSDTVQKFSGGMKRRLEIARGLVHAPQVLFLDEPTIGLDPQTRAAIWAYLHDLRRTTEITVFVTTHYMDEAEHCDRIAIMDNGEVVVEDTPEALKSSIGTDRIALRTDDDELAIARIRERLGVEAGVHEGQVTLAVAEGAQVVPRLFTELGVGIRSVTVTRPSLDDVFLTYTGRTIRDSEGAGPAGSPFAGRR